MKKSLIGLSVLFGAGVVFAGAHEAQADSNLLYRMYNPNSGEHFYTESAAEKDGLASVGWHEEGIAWFTPDKGDTVYRLYNPNSGDHHYTMSQDEYNFLEKVGWKGEGKSFYSADKSVKNRQEIYRAYNKNAKIGSHNFTANKNEQTFLAKNGWTDEGVAFYGNDYVADQAKNKLANVINEAKALDENNYTSDSWAGFAVALTQAQRILTADNSTKDDYAKMTTELTDYMNKLVEQASKFALKGALDRYNDFSKNSAYTAKPEWQVAVKLLPDAQAVYNDTNATQAEVDAIANKLYDALTAVAQA
ncbi:FIVAR domain-containing protein [Enterococcus sp. CSURQ0835]|uniref:FIVAR domain-containing protein n=1 Tax=Enterococcus sp. CSURQ0835 TaxID=2681394 RepID=UPI00135CEE24|nr:FIVAR domain-containing protein [Enterococcus sp. CSURQ0835]